MEIVVVAPHVLTRTGYRVGLEAGIVRGGSCVSDVTDVSLRIEAADGSLRGDYATKTETEHTRESAAEGWADTSHFDCCNNFPRSFHLTTMTWLSARPFLNSG